MKFSVEGQTICIIGGSSGIGLATARLATDNGASVIIAGRSEDRLLQASRQLPSDARAVICDACSEESVKALFERVDAVDHVLTTAGEFIPDQLTTTDLATLEHTLNSRVWSSVYAVRYGVPKMRGGGSFTFMSGTAAKRPEGAAVTSASCGAVEALARSLAVQFSPIRFNSIAPGYTRTPLWTAAFGEKADEALNSMSQKVPLKRPAEADEVAHAALFLMANEYVNGTVLTIDGGSSLV